LREKAASIVERHNVLGAEEIRAALLSVGLSQHRDDLAVLATEGEPKMVWGRDWRLARAGGQIARTFDCPDSLRG
jgi:hypothetical protein